MQPGGQRARLETNPLHLHPACPEERDQCLWFAGHPRLAHNAAGTIDVGEDQVRLEVRLPWLLSVFAEKLTPAITKEGTLMLEKPRGGGTGAH